MERTGKRKPRKTPFEEIQAMEQEAVSLRQRADHLEKEARKRLIELTCGTMADNYGAFDTKAFAAVFAVNGGARDEPETSDTSAGE